MPARPARTETDGGLPATYSDLVMLTLLGWIAVAALIAANALFVAAEFALTSVDRSKVTRLAGDGDRRAQNVLAAVRELSFQLSGAQLGITVCSLLLGFVAEPVIATALESMFHAFGLPAGAVEPFRWRWRCCSPPSPRCCSAS